MKLNIFDMEQQYNNDFEAYCGQNCVKQVLSFYGVDNPFMYFDTSLNIHLFKSEVNGLGYDLKFKENHLLENYNDKIHQHLPVNQSITKEKLTREVWEENKEKLREGIPVIAGVDIFHLDYSSYHNIYHSSHKVILCGYSEDDKYAQIIDWYEWQYKGNVELEQFLRSRVSTCPKDESPYSGYPIKNEWYEVEPSNWSGSIEENLKKTIDLTIRQYYETESNNKLVHNMDKNYSNEYYGVAALHKLLELVKGFKILNMGGKLEVITNIRVVFMILHTRLKLFRYYIQEASKHMNIELLTKLQEELNEDIEYWRKVVVIMLKSTVRLTDDSYDKIINEISRLIEIEERRYQRLSQINKIL